VASPNRIARESELSVAECRTTLATATVGHLGVRVGAEIAILAVNLCVYDRAIYFRHAPGEKLAELTADPAVAFRASDVRVPWDDPGMTDPNGSAPANDDHPKSGQVDAHQLASDSEKVAGLVEQIRNDALQGTVPNLADELRRRLADSGIELDAAGLERTLSALRQPTD